MTNEEILDLAQRLGAEAVAIRTGYSSARTSLANAEARQQALQEELELHKQAKEVVKTCIEGKLDVTEHYVMLVNMVLQAVFPEREFKFNIEEVYSEDEPPILKGIKMLASEGGGPWREVTKFGGGVTNIISEALRIISVVLSQSANYVILDEPSPNMDLDRWEQFVKIAVTLCEKLQIQMFMITHSGHRLPDMYKVESNGRESRVYRLTE